MPEYLIPEPDLAEEVEADRAKLAEDEALLAAQQAEPGPEDFKPAPDPSPSQAPAESAASPDAPGETPVVDEAYVDRDLASWEAPSLVTVRRPVGQHDELS